MNQARRLLAIAAVYEGMDRKEAARIGGMDRQTLRDWVHRFNAHGPEGLINIKPPGRPSRLSAEQKEELRDLVGAGDRWGGALALRRFEAGPWRTVRRSIGSEAWVYS